MRWGGLQCLIVVFSDHPHLLFGLNTIITGVGLKTILTRVGLNTNITSGGLNIIFADTCVPSYFSL